MNAERLLAQYERIAEAPDAVARLRRFILDLAVRGKLVPQDSKDEPASELLKRIAAEKARLVKTGEIRAEKPLPSISKSESLADLPPGWQWTRLGIVIRLLSGQHLQPPEYSNDPKAGPPYITGPSDFGPDGLCITRFALVQKAIAKQGQLLLTVKGSGVGKTTTCDIPKVAISRQLMALSPIGWERRYLALVTHQLADTLQSQARSLIPGISRDDVQDFAFAIPPLAEQHRIVTKVDELMALCDRLEAARAERESTRDRLTVASLARLNEPDPETFQADARFALDALPSLTARLDQIKQLRQTIVGLAVVGKLTSNRNDGPSASIELMRIATRKEQMALRKPKRVEAVSLDEQWCALPTRWEWARWEHITDWITYGFTRPMPHETTGVPIITGKNVNKGMIIFETADKTSLAAYQALNEKDRPQQGDILVTKDGSIGRTAIVDATEPFCINQSVAVLWLRSSHLDQRFLKLALDCPQTQAALLAKTEGVAIKHISVVDLGKMVFPLPPLAEQHRIVAKVDELMALCDQLEAALTLADATRSRLLDTLLHEALAPTSLAFDAAAE